MNPLRNTHIYKLLNKATINDGEVKMNSLTARPQHGVNVYLWFVYKEVSGRKLHFITIDVTEKIIITQYQELNSREQKAIRLFFFTRHNKKELIFK